MDKERLPIFYYFSFIFHSAENRVGDCPAITVVLFQFQTVTSGGEMYEQFIDQFQVESSKTLSSTLKVNLTKKLLFLLASRLLEIFTTL